MKKIFALLLAMIFVLMFASCGDETSESNNGNGSSNSNVGSTGNTDKSDGTDESKNQDGTDESDGPVVNSSVPDTPPSEDTPIGPGDEKDDPEIDTTKETVTDILGDALNVFGEEDTFGNEGQISKFTSYTAEYDISKLSAGQRVTIASGGIFRITGKNLNSQIYIKADGKNVTLLLDGVNLTSTTSGPPIYAEDCASVTIILAEGSSNRIEDSSINGENGAIKVKSSDLTFDGKGKLTIKANAKHGISNTKNLTIDGGTYVITSVGHGIYGKQSVTVNGGKFTINSAKSGIKSGDDEIGKETEGKIVIGSGSLQIRCNTNGLNSYGTIDIKNGRIAVESLNRAIDATKNINISGGTLIFTTEGDTIKSNADVNISGTAAIKISTYGNGIECVNLNVSTSTDSVIYVKTTPFYVEDAEGEYKYDNKEYVLIGANEVLEDGVKRYALVECKGFEVKGDIKLTNAKVGIDSFEDCLNATNIIVKNSEMALSTTKDAMDASIDREGEAVITIEGAKTVVNVVDSDKGIKAKSTVTLSEGETKILAKTDAIKANSVSVLSGRHILFDKVEYETEFVIRGGTVACISTTAVPVDAKSIIPYAQGVIANKDLCIFGQHFKLTMGEIEESFALPKDYTEKICVLFAAEDETMSSCNVTIGSVEETFENQFN